MLSTFLCISADLPLRVNPHHLPFARPTRALSLRLPFFYRAVYIRDNRGASTQFFFAYLGHAAAARERNRCGSRSACERCAALTDSGLQAYENMHSIEAT